MNELCEFIRFDLVRATLLMGVATLLLASLWRGLRILAAGMESAAWLLVLGQGLLLAGIAVPRPEFLSVAHTDAVVSRSTPLTATTSDSSVVSVNEIEPIAQNAISSRKDSMPLNSGVNTSIVASAEEIAASVVESKPLTSPNSSVKSLAVKFIAATWLAVVIALMSHSAFRYVQFLRTLSAVKESDDWRATLDECGGRSVRLLMTADIGPCMGWTPTGYFIAVPLEPWKLLSETERRAILLHELEHWRRGDIWRLMLGRIATSLHWFNPCAWWALSRLESATETACDEAVMNSVSATDYARVLMSLSSMRTSPSMTPAAGRGRLYRRVERILQRKSKLQTTRRAVITLMVTAMMLVGGVLRFQANDGLAVAAGLNGVSPADEPTTDAKTDIVENHSSIRSLIKLGDHRFAHRSQVDQVVFAPDGKWVASTCFNTFLPRVELWDAATGERSGTLVADETDQHGIESIAVSPNSEWLIGGQRDGSINVWRTADWKLVSRTKFHDAAVSAIVFSPDSALFASGTERGTVQLSSVDAPATVKHRWQIVKTPAPQAGASSGDSFIGRTSGIAALVFSTDGRRLLTGTAGDGRISVFDVKSGEILRTIEHAHPVSYDNPCLSSLHVLSETEVLSVGARTLNRKNFPPGLMAYYLNVQITELKVWNMETGELSRDLTAGRFDVGFGRAAVSPDTGTAVLGCQDKLMFFDLTDGVELRTVAIPGWRGQTPSIASNHVAVAVEQRISMWNLKTGRPVLPSPERNVSGISDCNWFDEGRIAAMVDYNGILNNWDAQTGQYRRQESFGPGGHSRSLARSADGAMIAAAGEALDATGRDFGLAQVWKADGSRYWQYHLNSGVSDCNMSSDGSHVVVATSNGSFADTRLHLLKVDGNVLTKAGEFPPESEPALSQCTTLAFTADNESVWIANGNCELVRWDIREKKAGRTLVLDWRLIIPGPEKRDLFLWDAVFRMENETVVISASDHIMVWDLTTSQVKLDMPIPGIAKGFNTLCVSPDGRYAAAAEVLYAGAPGSDTIRVFDLAEQTEILALTPHENRATALSGNSTFVACDFSR